VDASFDTVEHSVLVFYGCTVNAGTIEALFSTALLWSETFHCPFDKIGIGKKSLYDFRRWYKKIKIRGFGDISLLELHSIPEGIANRLDATQLAVSLSPAKNRCIVNFHSSILPIGSAAYFEIALNLIKLLQPSYGVGFKRTHGWGPSYYAMGLGCEGAPQEENDRARSWGIFLRSNLFLHGFIGGVYPWNFLTTSQLRIQVGKGPLEQWIQAKPHRGQLHVVAQNVVLWTVPDDEVANLWKTLSQARVIFDYERDVVAKMDEYNLSHAEVVDHLQTGKPLAKKRGHSSF
jgi:hypothetical protein